MEGDSEEVDADAGNEGLLERVGAIDVAKASAKVCVRIPDKSRRITRVWDVGATTGAIMATVLHNWVYVGKVFFRDALRGGPHSHLVDEKLFGRVQALLPERGEDYSKGASATSPFLLAGLTLLRPMRQALRRHLGCRKPLAVRRASPASVTAPSTVTSSAYGQKSLTTPSWARSSAPISAPTSSARPPRQPGAGCVRGTSTTIRSWPSSKPGSPRPKTPSSATSRRSRPGRSPRPCGRRLEGLATKVRDLPGVRNCSSPCGRRQPPPGAEVIAEMRHHIEKAVAAGSVPARKVLLPPLVHEIRVEGRDRVVPWFRVPGGADPKVRALARSAPPGGPGPVLRRAVRLSRRLELV